jgi:hypothetical protein
MHPDERPKSVSMLRAQLFGESHATDNMAKEIVPPADWGEILVQNRFLIGALLILLLIATVLSLWSPPIQGPIFLPG